MAGNDGQRERLQDAIRNIRRLQQRVAELESAASEPIAIVGMGCRYPGDVADPEAYWRLLEEGVDAISEVPPGRWDREAYFDPDPEAPGKMYTLAGGFVHGHERFDAELFGLSPREVAKIDPQHRLVLEVAWEALEHAGVAPRGLVGTATGVYLGITAFDYGLHLSHAGESTIDAYSMTGTKLNFAAGRLSYALGLQGPALSVDTACSSSLVAIHLACQALRRGECDMAVAGGVNAMLTPEQTIAECKGRMLSPNGRCRTFDADADGFVRGEGCGMLVMERLDTARRKGRPIIAVIRGSAVNQDGQTSGPTVPNRMAQEAVIRRALADAGVVPDDIDYVEAHGTATPLGDPIEVRALANVFGGTDRRRAPLRIGSVKTNFGHLESAAGIAGLMKAALALHHEAIPPHLHLSTLNPAVDWSSIPIVVVTRREPWTGGDRVRRAGVSSFGASGTNAHIVLEECRREEDAGRGTRESPTVRPYCLSAATSAALEALAARHARALAKLEDGQFADACHTVTTGRSHFKHRLAVVGDDVGQVRHALEAFAGKAASPSIIAGQCTREPRVAFLLPGRLGDPAGTGRELYETEAVFRQRLDECAEQLKTRVEPPLTDLLFGAGGAEVRKPGLAEPALVSLQYALAGVWMSWGVRPSAIVGHGAGEYAAACLAGALSLEEALALACARARLFETLPNRSSMVAVAASADQVIEIIGRRDDVWIAADNGPQSVVLAGDSCAIDDMTQELRRQGLPIQPIDAAAPLPSALTEPMLEDFVATARGIAAKPPRTRLVASTTGAAVDAEQPLDPAYWKRQLHGTFRLAAAMRTLAAENVDAFVEIGAGTVLAPIARTSLPSHRAAWVCSLAPQLGDRQSMKRALSSLYVHGAAIDWRRVGAGEPARTLHLPTYAFDRKRYWVDGPAHAVPSPAVFDTGNPLLGHRLRSPLETRQFESRLSPSAPRWLDDHRVFGHVVLPATAYFELLLAAGRETVGDDAELTDISIHAPLVLHPDGPATVQTLVEPAGPTARVRVLGAADTPGGDDRWTEHVTATIRIRDGGREAGPGDPERVDLAAAASRCPETVAIDSHYDAMTASGVEFGPAFRTVDRIQHGDREAIGRVRPPRSADAAGKAACGLHPATLDGCLQVARWALPESVRNDRTATYVPVHLDRLAAFDRAGPAAVCHAACRPSPAPGGGYELDLAVTDEQGCVHLQLNGLRLARIDRGVLDQAAGRSHRDDVYELAWRRKLAVAGEPDRQDAGAWLIFDYGDPMLRGCADELRAAGGRVWTVGAGDCLKIDRDCCTLRVHEPADFPDLLERVVAADPGPWTFVHAGGTLPDKEPSADGLATCQAVCLRSFLQLVQALEATGLPAGRLLVVTSGAQGEPATADGMAGAASWGLGRVVQTEFPRLDTRLLDLQHSDLAPQQLLAEARADDGEDQVLYRDGERYVARLVPAADDRPAADDASAYRLVLQTAGIPDSLGLQPMLRQPPGPGDVEIEVAAAGLNFRDVLVALGVYQGQAGPLGGECAGRVVAVGPDVREVQVGDEVIAFAGGAMASHVVADARLTWPKPAKLEYEQAAGLAIVFLTAAYCLHELGGMKRGDRVLIHGAAGGVGMAALQLARLAGAEIFATAGTGEKRNLVRSLGADHALDSRSLDFADEIMALTGGEGVDLVLNSLAGDFIPRSLGVTRSGGRFVEIGRTDIWSAEQVEEFRPGIDYHTVLLGDVSETDPERIHELGARIVADIDNDVLTALPVQCWPMDDAAEAFRLMARAGHTGKLVLRNDRFGKTRDVEALQVRSDGAYLVSGGFGGLGLEVARWLADSGAGMIVLLGRHAPGEHAHAVIDAIRESGVAVTELVGDVTRSDDVRRAVDVAGKARLPLRGVIHAAGTLDDGILAEQNWDRVEAVLAAKIIGGWRLHELTEEHALDFFVLFSSASALFGAAGQAGYAAGNAFLDTLARWRRGRGQPALSVNWGPWADAGMFVQAGAAGRRAVSERGFELRDAERNLATLAALLGTRTANAGVFAADWALYAASRPASAAPRLIAELVDASSPARPGADGLAFRERLAKAPAARRRRLMQVRLREEVAQVLNSSADEIRARQGFRELGMDSLMSVELRNRVERLLGCSLVSTLAFDYPNVEQLGDYLLEEVVRFDDGNDRDEKGQRPTPAGTADDVDAGVAGLTDAEAERLLMEELGRIREADEHG